MKKINQSLILKGIKEGLVLSILLIASYVVCFILYPIIIAITVKNGDFSNVKLFYEMWFINLVNIIVNSFLFFTPCLLGGIFWTYQQQGKKPKTVLNFIFVSTLVYLFGLIFVILFTRAKLELFSYDLITYLLFLSFTFLRGRELKKKSIEI